MLMVVSVQQLSASILLGCIAVRHAGSP